MLSDKIVELLNKITRYHVMSIASDDVIGHYIECKYDFYVIEFRIDDSPWVTRFKKRVNIRALNEDAVIADLEEILGVCVEYFGELDNE